MFLVKSGMIGFNVQPLLLITKIVRLIVSFRLARQAKVKKVVQSNKMLWHLQIILCGFARPERFIFKEPVRMIGQIKYSYWVPVVT